MFKSPQTIIRARKGGYPNPQTISSSSSSIHNKNNNNSNNNNITRNKRQSQRHNPNHQQPLQITRRMILSCAVLFNILLFGMYYLLHTSFMSSSSSSSSSSEAATEYRRRVEKERVERERWTLREGIRLESDGDGLLERGERAPAKNEGSDLEVMQFLRKMKAEQDAREQHSGQSAQMIASSDKQPPSVPKSPIQKDLEETTNFLQMMKLEQEANGQLLPHRPLLPHPKIIQPPPPKSDETSDKLINQLLRMDKLQNDIRDTNAHLNPHPPHKPPPPPPSETNPHTLRAYTEPPSLHSWSHRPLPIRPTTSSNLTVHSFPTASSSCTALTSTWPTEEDVAPTNTDPFLPWIHDVFPTADGRYVQFVAQNKRRCQTGEEQRDIKEFMQPNVALFQHVSVRRVGVDGETGEERFRLSSHAEADADGVETRFLCVFRPSNVTTLSVFNFNYDYQTFRKGYDSTFTEAGFDVHIVWNSQHLFRCPVPEDLVETVREGRSVVGDQAVMWVDLVPIRTPPRYIRPNFYLPPRFGQEERWNSTEFYGREHLLPRVEDSGRWENIPICRPSLMTYPDEAPGGEEEEESVGDGDGDGTADDDNTESATQKLQVPNEPPPQNHLPIPATATTTTTPKKHKLIACTWTSTGFHTRGAATFVSDGSQRLLQWIAYQRQVGVDHVYIYDNSIEEGGLAPITDLFPGFATRIVWPARVCNNNARNHRNKGERSSQYAAESSCRLRFGAHSDWLASFDTDEYAVPMGKYDNLKGLLDDMDKEDVRILNFASMRSKPRLQYLNWKNVTPKDDCPKCLDPNLPKNVTFLEGYNCNREKPPRKHLMAAEKQIYKTDYVLLHFVHYSSITAISAMTESQSKSPNMTAISSRYHYRRMYHDAHTRYTDEATEATMLHTKAIVSSETKYWHSINQRGGQMVNEQRVGVEYPPDYEEEKVGEDGGKDVEEADRPKVYVEVGGSTVVANCFSIGRVDEYWVPRLNAALEEVLGGRGGDLGVGR